MPHYAEYKTQDPEDIAEIARISPFALICKNGASGLPDIVSAPVLIREGGASAEFHIANANPAYEGFMSGGGVRIVFRAASAHISPAWYQERWRKNGGDRSHTAPTYNYVEAHLTGILQTMGDDELKTHLRKLVAQFEGAQGWRFEEMNEEFYRQLSAKITGFTVGISESEAIFKLSQEQNPADRPHIMNALQKRARAGDEGIASLMSEDRGP